MKKISILLLFALIFVSCSSLKNEAEKEETLNVITSFYPLYFFTNEVVGESENIKVTNLVPDGVDPHSYEISPAQMANLESADLIILQGAEFEPWFDGVKESLSAKGVKIMEVNSKLELVEFEDEHGHGEFDPHTWLDPVLVIGIIDIIRNEIIGLDLDNVDIYKNNAELLTVELLNLHDEFRAGLNACNLDVIITSHDAFGYLARRYNFEAHSISGLSPLSEPSAKDLVELAELVEHEGVQHIYFEVLADTKLAEVLRQEVNIEALVLNPIEGLESSESKDDYFSLMRYNLDNLKKGLLCE